MAKSNGKDKSTGNGILFFDPFPDEKNPAAGWGMLVGRGAARVAGDFQPAAEGVFYIDGKGKLQRRAEDESQVDKKP